MRICAYVADIIGAQKKLSRVSLSLERDIAIVIECPITSSSCLELESVVVATPLPFPSL